MTDHSTLVTVENVSFRYETASGESVLALFGIDLAIEDGEFIGLVGQNGSGKTTLARHLNGLLKPATGRVDVRGLDTRRVETGELASTVGYVFQNPDHALFLPTVREEIAYSLNFQELDADERERRIAVALETFGLAELADQHPASFGRGTRRLVVLAAAFAMEPDLLVLDEPTGGLDHRLTAALMRVLDTFVATGRSVVLISHDMQLVANTCRRVLVLAGGRLIADCEPTELFHDPARLKAAGLHAPDVARLSETLGASGIRPDTVAIPDFVDQVCDLAATRQKAGGT